MQFILVCRIIVLSNKRKDNKMTKLYKVSYIIKANGKKTEEFTTVEANNAKEACQICKEEVKATTGRNAFTPEAKLIK